MATTPMPVASVEAPPAAATMTTGQAEVQPQQVGNDLDSQLNALLNGTDSNGSGETQPAPEPLAAGTEGQQQGDQQQQQAAAVDEPDSDDPPAGVDIKPGRFARMNGGYKWAKELIGGLAGTQIESLTPELLPPVQTILEGQKMAVAHQELIGNLQSGTPEGVQKALAALHSAAPEGVVALTQQLPAAMMQASPEAFRDMAAQVMRLSARDPQAYLAIAKPAVDNFLEGMRQAAVNEPNPEWRKELWTTYKQAVWHVSGRTRVIEGDDPVAATAQQQQRPTDPMLEQERRAIAMERQRLEAIRQQHEQAQAAASEAWRNETSNMAMQTVRGMVSEALSPLKGKMADSILSAVIDRAAEEAAGTIAAHHEFGLFEQARQRDAMSRNPQMRQQIIDTTKRLVAAPLSQIAAKYLRENTTSVVTANGQRHDQLRQAAAQTGPASTTGTAPARSIAPPVKDLRSIPDLDGRLAALLNG